MPISTITTLLLASLGLDGVLWPQQTTIKDNAHYDYIIVGAGTAGTVLARRLAENQNHSVLLLEAGGNPSVKSLLPELFFTLPSSNLDYDYRSTFDDYAAGGQGNYTLLTAGKMLGGSAGLNHFLHLRGIPSDYDYWAEITGDDSWKYENILKYFIKSEKVDDDEIISKNGGYHGTEGPMGLTRQTHDSYVADYLASFAEAGNPSVLDLNADVFVGYTQPQLMIADGVRQQPAYSYLKPIKDFSNLYVSKNTRVSRILFENNTADGVEAIYNNKTYTFKANKEIILSAGVFNTPQILMLSGIGPQTHLKAFGIDVKADLPVGDNLMDQVAVTLVYKTKKYLLPIPDPIKLSSALVPTQIPFPVLVGSVALNKSDTIPNYQTYNLLFPHDTPYLKLSCTPVFGYRTDICARWQKQLISRDALYTLLLDIQPKSRGTVRLGSTDPKDDPVVTMKYYNDTRDLNNMLNYVKDFIKIGDTNFFQKERAALVGLDLPECADKERGTDEFWICYILNTSISPFHSSGTCPMGTVVDGELKVKGIQNLRIVDASVMPMVPHGAINAAVVMLAEKASDMIMTSI